MRAAQARKGKEWSPSKRKKKNFAIVIATFICITGIIFGLIYSNNLKPDVNNTEDGKTAVETPEIVVPSESFENGDAAGNEQSQPLTEVSDSDSYLKITVLDVGQGDCSLIACDGHYMIIDGGPDWAGTRVQKYLQSEGIQKLDYLVGTHFDADHIGGLDVVAYKFDCDMVLIPEYDKNTKTYEHLKSVIKDKALKVKHPLQNDKFSLGSAEITVLSPQDLHYEDDNDYSIVIMISYDGKRFLFTGDASEEAEKQMLDGGYDLQADVLKVAHHGSMYSSSSTFLEAISPRYAVISCGKENDYGHPHKAVLDRLQKCGAEVYRTDQMGNIIFFMKKGGNIEVK